MKVRDLLTSGELGGLKQWLGRGFWAVLDRGLFAASNFALTIILARWLTPQDYGAFIVAYAAFWLLGTLHTGLLAEPMLVFGPGKYVHRLSEYLGVLLYGHLGFASLGSVSLLLISLGLRFENSYTLFLTFFALALASPLILYQWLMRQACYVLLKPHLAAWAGTLYTVLILAGTYALYQSNWLSGAMAFGLMGFASLVTSLWLAVRLRVSLPALGDGFVREALMSHWNYGRWAAPTRVLMWIPDNIYYLILPFWGGGLGSTAALRALVNLLVPTTHFYDALSILLLPSLVRNRGGARFKRLVRLCLALFVLGALSFWLLLGLFHGQLVSWIYGGRYSEYSYLLWPLGFIALSYGMLSVFGAALRALERPDRVLVAYVLSTVTTLTVGLALLVVWGVVGAVAGFLVSSTVSVGSLAWFLYISGRTQEEDTEWTGDEP